METLAYLHCASTCEEIAPVEPVFGEDDAYLFDGLINVKRLSSLALLGLLPLSVAFSVMANPTAAQAGSHHHYGYYPHYKLYKKVVFKKIIFKKVVYYYKKHYRHYYYHYPKCKTVCYKPYYYKHYRSSCGYGY
ncbi:hypothetical protein [Floridanema evergladense]|uniref:Uncharacterized protein n=1 Tax=Floridaenema evergladense BLCC-F167 TaxID=3153639 RepID=A0ABV4WU05_9CYAN